MAATKIKKAASSSSTTTQWNIPEWRDAAAYPKKPDDLTDTEWRWEFLRRRTDYREDWMIHSQGTYQYLLAHAKSKRNLLTPNHPQFRATVEYLRATVKPGTKQEAQAFHCIQALRKYHLVGGLPNPAIPKPFLLDFRYSFGGMYLGDGEEMAVLIEQNHALYEIDLTRPIPAQLKRAGAELRKVQAWRRGKNENRRLHRRLLPRYLRVLDARECGTTYEQIGRVLLKIDDYDEATKRAKDLHTQARHIQNQLPAYF